MIRTSMTAVALATLLAACGTVPPAETADAGASVMPMAFAQATGHAGEGQDIALGWAVFDDPVLVDLVRQGLRANLDLRLAVERVERSRALAAGAHAQRLPGGGLAFDASARRLAATEAPGVPADERRTDSVSLGAGVAWEVDLFGRLRQAADAATTRARATEADADAVRLAVAAEVAHTWFALAGAREQIRLARAVGDNRRATLALVLRRVAAGHGAPLDEARARAELAAAEAELPLHEAAALVAQHRLAVLLGQSPSAFVPPDAGVPMPRPLALRVPDPARWAAGRPDLQAAEARMHAAALDVDAVRAEFLPRVTVAGVLGLVAGSVSGLGAAGSASWFVAPGVSLPLFDHARIQARVDAARSGQREALLAYRQQILRATEEVENALAQVRHGQHRLVALQERARHAARAHTLAGTRYEAGAADLLELLDAQRGAQQADLALASALTAQRQQVVALQRALGARFEAVTPA